MNTTPTTATTMNEITPTATKPPRQPYESTKIWANGARMRLPPPVPAPTRPMASPRRVVNHRATNPWAGAGPKAARVNPPKHPPGEVHVEQGLHPARQVEGQPDEKPREEIKTPRAEEPRERAGQRAPGPHDEQTQGIHPRQVGPVPLKLPQHLDVKNAENTPAPEAHRRDDGRGENDDPAVFHQDAPVQPQPLPNHQPLKVREFPTQTPNQPHGVSGLAALSVNRRAAPLLPPPPPSRGRP